MKKITALLLCLLMALSLAACGKSGTSAGGQDPADASASAADESDVEEFNIPEGYELKVAFDKDNAPYSSVNESGEVVGIDVDIAAALCELNGWKLSAQGIAWDANRESVLSDGKADCIWGPVSYSESNNSETLWSVYGGIYVDATVLDSSDYNKLSDLKGKKIEVEPTAVFAIEGDSATELGKQIAADAAQVDKVSDAATAYKDLAEGKCDAILVSAAADSTVDFDAFGEDVIFKALYDVDVYSSEGDSSEEEFEVLNSNGVCDLELGAGFLTDTDLYFAVAQGMENLLSQGKVTEILDDWAKKDNGAYADAVGRCNVYQMQEYEPDVEEDMSADWSELTDEDLIELEGAVEAESDGSGDDITEEVETDNSAVVVK